MKIKRAGSDASAGKSARCRISIKKRKVDRGDLLRIAPEARGCPSSFSLDAVKRQGYFVGDRNVGKLPWCEID
jgi:hypothetical protein